MRKASNCYSPPLKARDFYETITGSAGRFSAKVTFTDVTLSQIRELGHTPSSRVYDSQKTKSEWVIQAYAGESHK